MAVDTDRQAPMTAQAHASRRFMKPVERLARTIRHDPAYRCQFEAARLTHEERRLEVLLKCPDEAADGPGRHSEFMRSQGHGQMTGSRLEGADSMKRGQTADRLELRITQSSRLTNRLSNRKSRSTLSA